MSGFCHCPFSIFSLDSAPLQTSPNDQSQVLDEPTNHLDPQTVEALGEALKAS